MSIRIVTDSTCDLPSEIVREFDITVIPMFINMNHKSYLDGVEISREEFYKQLPGAPVTPTTSIPGIETFKKIYKKLIDDGATHILSIHIASSLSNMINAARLASDEFKDNVITVFDPGQISLGTGLVVKKAADLIRQGLHIGQILEQLQGFSKRVHSFASLDTLEFLRRSGRLSRLQYALGSFLQLKPIIFIHDGVSQIERVRTRPSSYNRIIEMVKALGPLEQLAVIYTRTRQYGEHLLEMAEELIPTGITPIFTEVTPVIGVHVGPDAAGLIAVLREPAA